MNTKIIQFPTNVDKGKEQMQDHTAQHEIINTRKNFGDLANEILLVNDVLTESNDSMPIELELTKIFQDSRLMNKIKANQMEKLIISEHTKKYPLTMTQVLDVDLPAYVNSTNKSRRQPLTLDKVLNVDLPNYMANAA